jgi:hypothetical protein
MEFPFRRVDERTLEYDLTVQGWTDTTTVPLRLHAGCQPFEHVEALLRICELQQKRIEELEKTRTPKKG